MRRGDITQASDEDFELSMKINVEAPFRLIRAAIPLMAKAGGGSIVNVSSCWGSKARTKSSSVLHNESCLSSNDQVPWKRSCPSKYSH